MAMPGHFRDPVALKATESMNTTTVAGEAVLLLKALAMLGVLREESNRGQGWLDG